MTIDKIMQKWTSLPLLFILVLPACNEAAKDDPWGQLDQIKTQIIPPTFPDRGFVITDYGAKPGGETLNAEAIARAIQECHEQGEGA